MAYHYADDEDLGPARDEDIKDEPEGDVIVNPDGSLSWQWRLFPREPHHE